MSTNTSAVIYVTAVMATLSGTWGDPAHTEPVKEGESVSVADNDGDTRPAEPADVQIVIVMPTSEVDATLNVGPDAVTSRPPFEREFLQALKRMSVLSTEGRDVEGQRPNPLSIHVARLQLREMWERGIEPLRVGPLPDGGTVLWFESPRGSGRYEIYNAGPVIRVLELPGGTDEIVEVGSTERDILGDVEGLAAGFGVGSTAPDVAEDPEAGPEVYGD
jgi:hypothetical protein